MRAARVHTCALYFEPALRAELAHTGVCGVLMRAHTHPHPFASRPLGRGRSTSASRECATRHELDALCSPALVDAILGTWQHAPIRACVCVLRPAMRTKKRRTEAEALRTHVLKCFCHLVDAVPNEPGRWLCRTYNGMLPPSHVRVSETAVHNGGRRRRNSMHPQTGARQRICTIDGRRASSGSF